MSERHLRLKYGILNMVNDPNGDVKIAFAISFSRKNGI